MTSCVPLCFRVLLALLLFLIETNRTPQVQAVVQIVSCQSKRFEQGEIISTKTDARNYCGSPVGWFFAVKQNVLFHLQCPPGAPSKATVKLLNMSDSVTRTRTFNSQMLCEIRSPEHVTTGNNAHLIAQRLADSTVPYDPASCNTQHYIEYMAYGKVNNAYGVKDSCPVFKTFNSGSTVNPSVFRLAGKGGVSYDWPTGRGGALTASTTTRQASSTFAAVNSKKRSYREQVADAEKLGIIGGRGGGGGGGFHGGSSGSRGGSEGGESVSGRVPYYAGAAGGGRRSSSSSSTRAQPFWQRILSWRSRRSG